MKKFLAELSLFSASHIRAHQLLLQSNGTQTFAEHCQEVTKQMSQLSVEIRALQERLAGELARKDLANLVDRLQATEKDKFFLVSTTLTSGSCRPPFLTAAQSLSFIFQTADYQNVKQQWWAVVKRAEFEGMEIEPNPENILLEQKYSMLSQRSVFYFPVLCRQCLFFPFFQSFLNPCKLIAVSHPSLLKSEAAVNALIEELQSELADLV